MTHPDFTVEQLLWLAALVSGGHGDLTTAAAIGMAESSGNPANYGINKGPPYSIDRGLWQINDYYHSEVSNDCAYRALCNARNAYRISNGWRSFTPWSTYTSGIYLEHLPPASALPVPIPDNQLHVRWTPDNGGGTRDLVASQAPFGHVGIIPSSTDGGPDSSGKIHHTGKTAGEHGTTLNRMIDGVHRLPIGRTRYGE